MATRQVTKRHRNTSSVSNMLNRLKWTSLGDRRADSRLISCHDIQNFHSEQDTIKKETY